MLHRQWRDASASHIARGRATAAAQRAVSCRQGLATTAALLSLKGATRAAPSVELTASLSATGGAAGTATPTTTGGARMGADGGAAAVPPYAAVVAVAGV